MEKKLLSIFFLLSICLTGICQDVKEVTLVTSGSAPTEEEATLLALRSAIEQTFGTFVSANTTILNDEIVKDEIVSVSKGNVKEYEKLYVNALPNGQVSVGVKATISISKLISYAKSKGSTAEFAGQTFAMNIKLMELREKNTIEAYKNMCLEAEQLVNSGCFEYVIELGDPQIKNVYGYKLYVDKNGSYEYDDKRKVNDDGYLLPVTIKVISTPITSCIYNLLNNTINSLMLTSKEVEYYEKQGFKMYSYQSGYVYDKPYSRYEELNPLLPVRDKEIISAIDKRLKIKTFCSFLNYILVDPTNSSFYIQWKSISATDNVYLLKPFYLGEHYRNNSLWFIDSNGYTSTSVYYDKFQFDVEGYVLHNSLSEDYRKENNFYYKGIERYRHTSGLGDSYYSMFSWRIDKNTNWNAWAVPNTTICEYNTYIFIPKEQMMHFGGLSIIPHSTPLEVSLRY